MSKPKSASHMGTNAFCPHRIRTVKPKPPSEVCILFHSFRNWKMFSKIHFAGLVGKWPFLSTTVFCKEQKLHFPQLHSGEQLCRSYSRTWSTERDLQAWEQLHKHPWDFLGLHKIITGQVSSLNTEGSVSITDFPSCSQHKSKLPFNLAKKVRREVKEEEISIQNFFFFFCKRLTSALLHHVPELPDVSWYQPSHGRHARDIC